MDNTTVMPRFICPYVSDGSSYTVTITAPNAAEAAKKLRAIPWGPNSGPTGPPRRVKRSLGALGYVAVPVMVAAFAIAMSARHLEHEIHKVETAIHADYKHLI